MLSFRLHTDLEAAAPRSTRPVVLVDRSVDQTVEHMLTLDDASRLCVELRRAIRIARRRSS